MPSKMSGHLYHEVDCSNFYGQIYSQPIFFQYICCEIAHQANPGVVCLTGSRKNLTVSPNGDTVLSYIPDTPLSFETKKKELLGGVITIPIFG